MKRVLIAGIGNIFHGDDGFGVAVARQLQREPPDADIEIVDFGIRALDLVYALTGGCRFAILVDTVQRGSAPGTLYAIEPELSSDAAADASMISPHEMDPVAVLRMARVIGGECAQVMLVGCEPQTFGDPESAEIGLSAAVATAVDGAAAVARRLADDWLQQHAPAATGDFRKESLQ